MGRNTSGRKGKSGKRLLQQQVRNWKRTLIVTLALFVLLAAGITALAEYTRASWARRVVGAYEASGSLFSSNYLLSGDSLRNRRTIFVTVQEDEEAEEEEAPPTAMITVCNYAQGNPGKHYDKSINYTLTWRMVVLSEENGVQSLSDVGGYSTSVERTGADVASSYSGTLDGSARDQHIYIATFDPDMLTAQAPVFLEVVVTQASGFLDLPTRLTGLFDLGQRGAEAAVSWGGSFDDDKTVSPATYDGFNYTITGSGSGTCTLSWDSAVLTLSELSRQTEFAGRTDTPSGTILSIEFPVDSTDKDRYDLQFYWAPGSDRSAALWNAQGIDNTSIVRLDFSDE